MLYFVRNDQVIFQPNPADDRLQLNITAFDENKNYQLKITAADGKEVLQKRVKTASVSINSVNLEDGIYYYQLLIDETEIHKGQFIIIH